MNKLGIFCLLTLFLTSTTVTGQVDGKRKKGRDRGGALGGQAALSRMLQTLDKNKDGKLSQAEAPERMKERFAQMDGNSDGFVDADELKQAFARRMQRGGPGKSAGDNSKKGDAAGKGPGRAGPGRGLDLAALFKAGDKDGDGNLNPAEQKAIIAKVNEMMERFRQMRGKDGKQKGGDRYARPNTDPVKPKRPGMQD